MPFETLMGDEAIALGAVHAGLTAAFAYPGTPSTEIMEFLQTRSGSGGGSGGEAYVAQWCANEKSAYEAALGVSFAGGRASVSMKHVGLNVAMDPFANSALVKLNGGLVLIVADDPGMHSSQDEQDSRLLADFARVPCLEPADQQEAYDMAREAFALSESLRKPVLLRLTTRLAHSRSGVSTRAPEPRKPIAKAADRWSWLLMPQASRRLWKETLASYDRARAANEECAKLAAGEGELGVVTCGLALEYYRENEADLAEKPHRLHVSRYPLPEAALRELASKSKRILVLEEGYPYVERCLRGLLPSGVEILGKESGALPRTGELSPDLVRRALGLPPRPSMPAAPELPERPPQFCQGCPHADSYAFLKEALSGFANFSVNGDIGCYTLGALEPYDCIETAVCMGASIGMARGASEAGLKPAVAIIGDSTFYHSGIPPLIDAVSHNSSITVYVLDNSTTAMTGAQPTILGADRIKAIAIACGVAEEHVHVVAAHKDGRERNVELLRRELAYEGPSVVISTRACIEALKKARKP
jgi:Indolepyruvate ferredoxin oxidoreductase, alpha and beta subunits